MLRFLPRSPAERSAPVRTLLASACLLGAAAATTSSSSTAQSVGDWRRVEAVTLPPSRTGFSLVPLPSGEMLLFGGDAANPSATEWLWDGIDWSPTQTPVLRRDNAAVARDAIGRVYVFGGVNGGNLLSSTFVRDLSGTWSLVPSLQPGILLDASMAYDAVGDRMVLVGKQLSGMLTTWLLEGQTWVAGPVIAAQDARVVEDGLRREALLISVGFGTTDVSRLDENGVWQLLDSSPTQVQLDEAAYDARRLRVTLVEASSTRSTVDWSGEELLLGTRVPGSFVAPGRTALGYDPRREELLMVADYGNGIEMFRHAAESAPSAFPFGATCGNMGPLELASPDQPQPGGAHRLRSTTASPITLSVLGFSHVQASGQPLPQPIPLPGVACDLLVEPLSLNALTGTPVQLVSIPASSTLLGVRYDAQFVGIDAAGVSGASNGLEVQIGAQQPTATIVESFTSTQNRDALASGDLWTSGLVEPSQLGGDGRHGSFSTSLGTQVSAGVYEIDTDNTVIPASRTLTGVAETIVDGRFFFTDFVVPQGVTVRFVGTSPAIVRVRGRVDVQGVVSVDAAPMPSAVQQGVLGNGELISTFNARGAPTSVVVPGQPGGAAGPGGGRGGNGGNEGTNNGPQIVNGVNVTNGQPGEDVRVAAGHAYAAQAAGTGGAGSILSPATGVWATTNRPLVPSGLGIYAAYFSPGGGGGGFVTAGSAAAIPQHNDPNAVLATTPPASGGNVFPLQPYPPQNAPAGYSSLEHFAVGGSGGGGGGSHGYGLIGLGSNPVEKWMAGHGGSGGGGVLVLRAGGNVDVDGAISSRGGRGVLIQGDDPAGNTVLDAYGISSPGGGGSGGSILLQSGGQIEVNGSLDTSGGAGSRVGLIAGTQRNMDGRGGAGSTGFWRLESSSTPLFLGSGVPQPTTASVASLSDDDAHSGSRSLWLPTLSPTLPRFLRYELLVEIGGLPVLFSDDPAVSPLSADDPTGAVLLRMQSGRFAPATGGVAAGSAGPWRSRVAPGDDSINIDRGDAVRFDLTIDKSLQSVRVLELRIVWR